MPSCNLFPDGPYASLLLNMITSLRGTYVSYHRSYTATSDSPSGLITLTLAALDVISPFSGGTARCDIQMADLLDSSPSAWLPGWLVVRSHWPGGGQFS